MTQRGQSEINLRSISTHGGFLPKMTKLRMGCLLSNNSLSASLLSSSCGIRVTVPLYVMSVGHVTVKVSFSQLSSA